MATLLHTYQVINYKDLYYNVVDIKYHITKYGNRCST